MKLAIFSIISIVAIAHTTSTSLLTPLPDHLREKERTIEFTHCQYVKEPDSSKKNSIYTRHHRKPTPCVPHVDQEENQKNQKVGWVDWLIEKIRK